MAAPQFSTFPPRNNKRRPRHSFTPDEANRSLPLVARIVRDIVNTHERAAQLQAKLEESPNAKDAPAVHAQFDETVARLQDYIDELTGIGVLLKDYETGLVDFPSRHQDRDIYLCWKLGEEKIDHWHELHTGYAGRQPLASLRDEP